jgi:hypothetical protein
VLQRHPYNLGIAAAGAAPHQLLRKRIAADAFAPVFCFAGQHLSSQLRLAKKARGGGFRHPAVTLQQFDHFPVALVVRLKDGVAAGVNFAVRVSSVFQQNLRHFVLAELGAMVERHSPGECDAVGVHVFHAGAFVRVKAKIEQQLQNIRSIAGRGDAKHASGAFNRVDQQALRVPRPKPARVPERHSSPRCQFSTRPYEPVRDIFEFGAFVRVR